MKLKTRNELAQMSNKEIRDYRWVIWAKILEQRHNDWLVAQRTAWAPLLRAIDRSNESRAALVLKSGAVTQAIITVEFFQGERPEDALVRLSVDRRGGHKPEEYAPYPDELMPYLQRLGLDPYHLTARWEPV